MQEGLFDLAEANRGRDRGIAQGYNAAKKRWREAANEIIQRVCETHEEFTTDIIDYHLSRRGDIMTRDLRALGGAMMAAQNAGLCTTTDRVEQGKKKCAHGRPKRVWKSLICHG